MTFRIGQVVGAFHRRRPHSRGVDWHKATVTVLSNRRVADDEDGFTRNIARYDVGLKTICGQKFTHRSDLLEAMQRQPIMLGSDRRPSQQADPVFYGDRLCPGCWPT